MTNSKSRLSQNEQLVKDEDHDSQDSSDEDNLHEEPPDMRVQAEFLKNLPGVQASDSMGYRIEALRVYLETQLGETALKGAYQHFMSMDDNDDDEGNAIDNIIGPKKLKFVPLIHHLIYCEDNYYTN